MNEQAFVDRRQRDWTRLAELTDKAMGSKLERLSGDELREFVKLYRRVSTDLAVARTKSRNSLLSEHLNALAANAYAVLYRSPRKGLLASLRGAVTTAAQTVRARSRFILVAALIFFGSAIVVYSANTWMPETKDPIIGPNGSALFDKWKEGKFEERSGSESVMMGAMYASHNPQVAIMEAGVGAGTFGVASIYLLFQNGALVGALASEMSSVGKLPFLISSLGSHGVPELSGAIISGAAGLLFGWALINPGRKRRGDALRSVAKDGVVLILTSVVLMCIAAPIEAFFSFNPAFPQEVKAVVAGVSLCAWMAFWTLFGRE